MDERYSRMEPLFGADALARLASSRVAVFGAGGVGGYAIETLARSGAGAIDVFDGDVFARSNLNRQLLALESTIGRAKAEVAAERIAAINPRCAATAHRMFYGPGNSAEVDLRVFSCVIDAVDDVAAKKELVRKCGEASVPLVCCTGAGNRFDPTAFRVADIHETHGDPLARIMRAYCREAGVEKLRAVFSTEPPRKPATGRVPASGAFAPAAAGLAAAYAAVACITGVPFDG